MIIFFQLQSVRAEEPRSPLTPALSDCDTINVDKLGRWMDRAGWIEALAMQARRPEFKSQESMQKPNTQLNYLKSWRSYGEIRAETEVSPVLTVTNNKEVQPHNNVKCQEPPQDLGCSLTYICTWQHVVPCTYTFMYPLVLLLHVSLPVLKLFLHPLHSLALIALK